MDLIARSQSHDFLYSPVYRILFLHSRLGSVQHPLVKSKLDVIRSAYGCDLDSLYSWSQYKEYTEVISIILTFDDEDDYINHPEQSHYM